MHHRPLAGTPHRSLGVVLCAPVGWEMIASHRSHRALADLLCSLGFHVLRFDYPGTGDSAGDEIDPGRLRAWLDGIGFAAAELKRRAGIAEICLVGVRFGAVLSALFAGQGDAESPAAMVLWAPFLKGRAYLREVRAYQALNEQRNVGLITTEGDTAGFVLTPETAQALNEVDLLKLQGLRCRAALVLARDEHSNEDKLAELLEKQGVDTEFARIPGVLPMLQEPRKSVIPQEVFARIAAWLDKTSPPTGLNVGADPQPNRAVMTLAGLREEASYFGPDAQLFGIATLPDAPASDRPAVLWLNTANDHRIGPNRSYVPLARSLAALGYPSFRFDPRDVGDGGAAPGSHAYSAQRHADVLAAMDFVQSQYGFNKLVLVGLCSGAYMAFHFGEKDPRVVGEVLVNPQTFEWKEGDSFDIITRTYRSTRAYKEMLLDPKTWKRALGGEVRVGAIAMTIIKRGLDRGMAAAAELLPARPGQPRSIKRIVKAKLRRKLKLLLVLAENDGALDFVEVHLGHRARSVRSAPGFTIEVVPGVDHTFSQRWAKDQLAALVLRHLTRHFSEGVPTEGPPSSRHVRKIRSVS